MKKNVLKILLLLLVLVFGIVLQDKAQDYATIVKISNATKKITRNSENVQIRVKEKYNDGREKISETYIKDGVYVTRRVDAKNSPSNSLEWASTNPDVICNVYSEYEYELDGKVIKELTCGYNHASGSETQAITRMAIGNLLLMYDKDVPTTSLYTNVNIFNMPKIENSEYDGKACYSLKTGIRTWYVEKETLRTLALECELFEDDSPCLYTFEYDIETPEGIYEEPDVTNAHYDKVEFFESLGVTDKYENINDKKEKAISGTNLNPGEELVEVVELKENEKLNFLGLTANDFGLKGFNIYTLETYNKFREKYSALRELTEEDFEEYYVGIAYKDGYKLNYLQSVDSTRGNKMNYIFKSEKSNKASLVLVVTPITNESRISVFVENSEKLNITEEAAIKTVSENIKELNSELVLDADGYVNVELSEIVVLDNEMFASLDVIKTPVKGKEPICWKLTVVDSENTKLDVYVNMTTGEIIGSINK